ncbi:MAG: ABC transporter permease, partial [Firmicutes bacterium]|nr:ABC transporter permease [Bacillota bacterium]
MLFILLFGMIFSNMGQNVHYKIGVALEEKGPVAEGVLRALQSVPVFTVYTGREKAELQALKKGERSLVVVLPAGMSLSAMMGVPAQIPVYYDATDRMSNQVLLPAVSQIFDEAERRMTRRPKIFSVAAQAVNPKQLKEIDYLLPGILAMALMQLGLFGALRLVSLREQKIL